MDSKIVAAVIVVFLGLVIGGFLIHALWLQSTYQLMRDSGFSFRTPEALQHRLWIIWLSDLLYAILFVWVYVRGREDKPWPAQGFPLWCTDDLVHDCSQLTQRVCGLQSAPHAGC